MEKTCKTCANECIDDCDRCQHYDGVECHQQVDCCRECLDGEKWEQKELKPIEATISLYFAIEDSELYGGKGEIGYAESKADINVENFSKIDIEKYISNQVLGLAELCKVSPEKIRIIPRNEYE